MGGRAQFFQLLAGEDVDSDEMDLGVTVLAGLGGAHVNDLAGTVLDHDVTVLAQGRTLHRVGSRGAGIGRLEGVLMLEVDASVGRSGCAETDSAATVKRCVQARWCSPATPPSEQADRGGGKGQKLTWASLSAMVRECKAAGPDEELEERVDAMSVNSSQI